MHQDPPRWKTNQGRVGEKREDLPAPLSGADSSAGFVRGEGGETRSQGLLSAGDTPASPGLCYGADHAYEGFVRASRDRLIPTPLTSERSDCFRQGPVPRASAPHPQIPAPASAQDACLLLQTPSSDGHMQPGGCRSPPTRPLDEVGQGSAGTSTNADRSHMSGTESVPEPLTSCFNG